jgi:putative ABC transport system substrate-binding protein
MRRRAFLSSLVGAAAWPVVARGQQPGKQTIGILGSTSPAEWASFVEAFREGLRQAGFNEGGNLAIEFRWAESRFDRLPALAADLVGRGVAAILATGGSVSAVAAKSATATTPVVFVIGADPVRLGLVASLNRPGGNVTGVSFLLNVLVGKRLELLREIMPAAKSIGLLVNPKNPNAVPDTTAVEAAARGLGLQTHVVNASSEAEFPPAFAALVERRVEAMLTLPDPFFLSRRNEIVALATGHALPAIYDRRELAAAGGLISYGTSFTDAHREAGTYVARILKGEKPADLPVLQSTKYEFVVNLKTAKTLGLTIPHRLLVAADEVIE